MKEIGRLDTTNQELIRILVCGGRTFNNKKLCYSTLDTLCLNRGFYIGDKDGNWLPRAIIINGGAKGADHLSTEWAMTYDTGLKEYPADWDQHGKAAGPIRNQQMLDEGKPDIVVAFPGGRGTADMVRRAKKAGIEVIEVENENMV